MSVWETFLWTQYLGRRPCLYFVNSPCRVWCRGPTQHKLPAYSWHGDLYKSFSMTIFHHLSFLDVCSSVYCKSLLKAAQQMVLWTSRRKSLHFVLSICLILVVWGPVQVFVFKSNVYQGTDPAGIIITRLSEMSRRTRTCLMGNVKGALSFLTTFQSGHFHTRGTCQGSPNPNGKFFSRKMRAVLLTTEWYQTELRYGSR